MQTVDRELATDYFFLLDHLVKIKAEELYLNAESRFAIDTGRAINIFRSKAYEFYKGKAKSGDFTQQVKKTIRTLEVLSKHRHIFENQRDMLESIHQKLITIEVMAKLEG